ncbi:hypothetical protein REPUB_Repub14bG0063800 [Reevesia pubescens]
MIFLIIIEKKLFFHIFYLGFSDCGRTCAARCRLSSRPHQCKSACGTCCSRYNCVPSGIANNQEMCPC